MRPLESALVTGASGFLGSVLVDRLVGDHVEVTALVRSKSQALPRLARLGVRVLEVDSWDADVLATKLKNVRAEVLFHLASYGVHPDQREPDQLIDGNIGLITTLLKGAAHLDLRLFIHTGSCSEYGSPEMQGRPIAETDPLRPTSLYGAAKAGSVSFGSILASQLGLPFVTLRLFGVFGPHESPHRLVPYLIRHLENDLPVDLTPGDQVRDFLFEEDVADAFVTAAKSDNLQLYDAYNICSSVPTRIREVGERVADEMGKRRELLRWGERPYRGDEPMWLVGDNQKFARATSWHPTTSWRDGVRRTIAHFRNDTVKLIAEKHA